MRPSRLIQQSLLTLNTSTQGNRTATAVRCKIILCFIIVLFYLVNGKREFYRKTLSRSLSHFVNSPATFLTKQGIFAATVGYWQIRSSARPFFMLWVSHPLISFIAAVHRTYLQDSSTRPDEHQIHLRRWGVMQLKHAARYILK